MLGWGNSSSVGTMWPIAVLIGPETNIWLKASQLDCLSQEFITRMKVPLTWAGLLNQGHRELSTLCLKISCLVGTMIILSFFSCSELMNIKFIHRWSHWMLFRKQNFKDDLYCWFWNYHICYFTMWLGVDEVYTLVVCSKRFLVISFSNIICKHILSCLVNEVFTPTGPFSCF